MKLKQNLRFDSYEIEAKFKKLPKLVRALICKHIIPLKVVYNVEFLRMNTLFVCHFFLFVRKMGIYDILLLGCTS